MVRGAQRLFRRPHMHQLPRVTRIIAVMMTGLLLLANTLPQTAIALSIDELRLTPPPTPKGASLEVMNTSLRLKWDADQSKQTSSYLVRIWSNEEQRDIIQLPVSETTYLANDLPLNTMHYMTVSALDAEGNESEPSAILGAIPHLPIPAPVTGQKLHVAAWITTNWDAEDARRAFNKNLDVFDTISPFWYNMDPDGNLSTKGGARDVGLIQEAHQNGIRVIPTITNNFSAEKATQVLSTSASRKHHIDVILNEVLSNDYDGIDIDYENVATSGRDAFSSFVTDLASALHSRGKLLSVTVQAKLSDTNNWNGPGGTDYAVIGPLVDQFRIMTYDYHRSNSDPGPIAPIPWIKQAIGYAKQYVAPEKILAGLPFYGYDWSLTHGENDTSAITWDGVQQELKQFNPTVEWDAEAGESYYTYTSDGGENLVYFQDARSIKAKTEAIMETGVAGVTIWRLGSEDPEIFQVFRTMRTQSASLASPGEITVTPARKEIHLSWKPTDAKNQAGYAIGIGTTPGQWTKVIDATGTSFTLKGLASDELFFIGLMSVGPNGQRGQAATVIAVEPVDQIYLPTVTDLKAVDVGAERYRLTWTGYSPKITPRVISSRTPFDAQDLENTSVVNATIHARGDDAGEAEVSHLSSGETFYVAIMMLDHIRGRHTLSNVVPITTKDLTPPSVVTQITSRQEDMNTVIVSWQPASDAVGGYIVYTVHPDGSESSTYAGDQSHLSLDFVSEGIYAFSVVAIDAAGNQSVRSAPYRLFFTPQL